MTWCALLLLFVEGLLGHLVCPPEIAVSTLASGGDDKGGAGGAGGIPKDGM